MKLKKIAKQATEAVISALKDSGAEFNAYIQSDQFEADVDELAHRLRKDGTAYPLGGENRALRVQGKCIYLLRESGADIRDQSLKGEFLLALPVGGPKAMAALALISGGYKTYEILTHCVDVFAPKTLKVITVA